MEERELQSLLKDIPKMSRAKKDDTETVLEELQHAVEEHEKILARQAALLARLRRELKDVDKR